MSRWQLPVINLCDALAGDAGARGRVAAEIDRACRDIGFLVVEGHGVPEALFARAFVAAREFFDLPVEEKMHYHPADGVAPRGYHALGTRYLARTLGEETPPDLREQFYVGPLAADPERYAGFPGAARFYSENIWPRRPAAYREVFTEYYTAFESLAAATMRLFALGLGLDEHHFDDKIDHHFNTCPVNHYPVVPGDPKPGQLRAGAHSDFGSLTMLAFDDAPGGLQVRMPDGGWLDVAPGPGQLVVNIGDMMARWTNDRWKSTVHRVVNPLEPDRTRSRRITIGYFLHPNYDAEVACLPTCAAPGEPPIYPSITAGEHMREKMERRASA
jgi:isopenicillin N synthase-like dioxygenase